MWSTGAEHAVLTHLECQIILLGHVNMYDTQSDPVKVDASAASSLVTAIKAVSPGTAQVRVILRLWLCYDTGRRCLVYGLPTVSSASHPAAAWRMPQELLTLIATHTGRQPDSLDGADFVRQPEAAPTEHGGVMWALEDCVEYGFLAYESRSDFRPVDPSQWLLRASPQAEPSELSQGLYDAFVLQSGLSRSVVPAQSKAHWLAKTKALFRAEAWDDRATEQFLMEWVCLSCRLVRRP